MPLLPTRRLALLALSACALAHTPAARPKHRLPEQASKVHQRLAAIFADVLARSLGDALQTQLKQPFITENKPPAQVSNIGADMVLKSPADGYTVMFGIDTTFTINPHIYPTMPFKPGDLGPLMVLTSPGMMVVAHPSTGFKSLSDMVAAGKAKGVNFSSAGSGSSCPPGRLRYWVTPRA